jgi:predicted nuclease with TOPRIM domain
MQKLQEQHDRENAEYISQKQRMQGEIDSLKTEIELLKAKISELEFTVQSKDGEITQMKD